MSRENRMFDEMMKAARQRLADRDPAVIAKNANVAYSDGAFRFQSLGVSVTVGYPECEITPELPGWHALVIMHYLDLADGTPLTGKTITFAQEKDTQSLQFHLNVGFEEANRIICFTKKI